MSGIQQLLLGGSVQQAVDPFFYSVTSLLHGDGTNGGQNNTFLDSSTNNFTITRNGNTTQGSFSPFSQTGWGVYQPSTASDYVNFTTSAGTLFQFTGDYTIETWVFSTVLGSDTSIWITNDGSANYHALNIDATNYNVYLNSGSPTSSISHGLQLNQWNHVAMVRNGSTITLYTNGVARGTITNSSTNGYSSPALARIGGGVAGSSRYLSNFRIVKGTAVYTAAFTPPTTPLTAISGTSLLTCQANRFLDASSNALVPTVTGSPSIQPFSPFNPTTPYSTSSIGGSGYFDGSGDYLTIARNTAFIPTTGDFTVEAWVYVSSLQDSIICGLQETGVAADWSFALFTDGRITLFIGSTVTSYFSTATYKVNQWNHIMACRSGSTLYLGVNGAANSTTATGSLDNSRTYPLAIGSDQNGDESVFSGFISGLRFIKGSAAYASTTYTVPTAPPTAITDTSLLLNFTNGAIFDNAAVADYETVGNAQISTSVKKYGTGSLAFDGTGDYLLTDPPSAQLMAFGTGDFTIEFWAYFNTTSGDGIIYDSRGPEGFYPTIYRSTTSIIFYTNSAARITASSAVTTNTWYHIALCRTGTSTKMFINGTQVGSTYTDTNAYLNAAQRPIIGAAGVTGYVGVSALNGYIDDLRISKGIARYPYNFTPPTAEFPNIGGTVTLTADPNFEYTTLLLPGNGTNGAQNNTFLDSSTNNFTITRNGNTTQGTFSPFSQTGWGNYFNFATPDALRPSATGISNFGTGAFTVEFWINFQNTSPAGIYYGGTSGSIFIDYFSGSLRLGISGGSIPISYAFTPAVGIWYHVAFVRSSTTDTLYINGTSVATGSDSQNYPSDSGPYVGSWNGGTYTGAAYLSNVRVVKGTAVYTANFTPSTIPLTAISGTSLLTCQSNRFLDNSSNAFAITTSGSPSVQAFSPFNPTAAWSASTNGGSGYFDGSGDYLSVPNNAAFSFGSDAFTIEMWIYKTKSTTAGTYDGLLYRDGNWRLKFQESNSIIFIATSTQDVKIVDYSGFMNSWNHLAIVRSGNTISSYVNGTLNTSITETGTLNSTSPLLIAYNGDTFGGYISSLRIVKGTAVYTAAFTPPTAPLTAITNTSLLTNYTNAGIYDATSKNDLETVGNAQISTTQSKFGGSSMYFDGTDDRLPAPASVDIAIGTADFTIEGWFYTASPATNRGLFQISTTAGGLEAGNTNNLAVYCSSSVLGVYYASTFKAGTTSISANTWTHFALVRYSGSTKLYVNGITDGGFGTNADTQNYTGKNVCVGGYFSTSYLWSGYIQDFRITKGIARYTSNFTPPTTAFLTL